MSEASESRINDFLRLLMANQKPIFAFILGLVPNREDARDIFQETVLVMWAKFDSFEEGSNFVGWGITIARYKVLQAQRQYSRNSLQLSSAALEAVQSKAEHYVQHVDKRIEAMQSCIRKLNKKDHDLIHMRYEKEMDIKTIADGFNRSVQSVYKRFSRIHQTLMECIRRTLDQEELV